MGTLFDRYREDDELPQGTSGKYIQMPGNNFFKCLNCKFDWDEKCGDIKIPPERFCKYCGYLCKCYKSEPHPKLPVDKSGNLIDEDV
jgi:hypothetical protein